MNKNLKNCQLYESITQGEIQRTHKSSKKEEHKTYEKRVQALDRNYLSTPYDEDVPVMTARSYEPVKDVIMKITFFGQTKRSKEVEFLVMGNAVKLQDLVKHIE